MPIQLEDNASAVVTPECSQQQMQINQVLKQPGHLSLLNEGIRENDSAAITLPVSPSAPTRVSSAPGNVFINSLIPIDIRGPFFQDSFFENSRRQFEDAVNRVMKRVNPEVVDTDPFNWYSTIKKSDMLEDTRAGTISTEGNNYKVDYFYFYIEIFNSMQLNKN